MTGRPGAADVRRGMKRLASTVFGRYNLGARWYDVLSGERAVYRAPRLAGVAQLRLRPGQRVLDVGSGTGLNFPDLRAGVGPSGEIVGLDSSPKMLRWATARSRDWPNVHTVRGDAGDLDRWVDGRFDAVLFTYSLSIIGDWRAAFGRALDLLRPGGRVVVVDLALPTGPSRLFWPLARLACWTGGVDPYRAPWTLVEDGCVDVSEEVLRGGHVRVVAGTHR